MEPAGRMPTEDGATVGVAGAAPLTSLTGRSLGEGRFQVEAQLGQGAQGAVFRVRRTGPAEPTATPAAGDKLDRHVPRPRRTPSLAAMKVLIAEPGRPEITERFLAEYRIMARLRAGPFVHSYEMFEEGDLLCYTMDLMPGGSLAGAIGAPLPVAVAVGVVLDVLEGLDLLHGQGIIHRDVKHHNILLDGPLPVAAAAGSALILPRAKLADFGISDVQDMVFGDRVFDSQIGTPYFMAPEFGVRDTVDARVDLYAVGVLLFMLLTGQHPGSSSTSRGSTELAVRRQLAGKAIEPLRLREVAPHVPDVVVRVVSQLLEPDPNRRLRTAALAFDALHAWFVATQDQHRVQLSHPHALEGKPYLAAAAFAGRQSELAQSESFLHTVLATAATQPLPTASALVVSGEAGMGKSRLTHGIRRKAQRLGFAVHGVVGQRGQGAFVALDRLRQHFRNLYAAALLQATPEEVAAGSDPHHRSYVPDRERDSAYVLLRQAEVRPEERPAYNELAEHYLLDRFAAEVRFASYQTPQCIFIEDAQWLDAGTIKCLFWCMRYLSSSRARGMPVRVAWILTYRPNDPEGDNVEQVEAQLAGLGRLEEAPLRLQLHAFTEADACEVVASMLQLPADAPEVQRLVTAIALKEQRQLSPLYVEQSVWTLFASGILAAAEAGQRWQGRWKLDAAHLAETVLPSSVREAIGSRASRLSIESLRVLGVAAMAGREFDVEVVSRAAELDAENVLGALEQAGKAGFVLQERGQSRRYLADGGEGDARYRFSHDRYRESIASRLEPAARRLIHGQLARAVRARWGESSDTHPMLARHHFGAEEYPQAFQSAKKVAEQAHAEGNHERAADYYCLALDSHRLARQRVDDDAALRRLRDQAAESLAAVGRFAEANAQLQLLLEDRDVPKQKRLDCQRRIAESYFIQHDFQNATAQLTKVLALLGLDLKVEGLKKAAALAQGALSLLVRGPFGLGFNRLPAESPLEDVTIAQTLYTLAESAAYVDLRLSLTATAVLLHRTTTRGLNPLTPAMLLGCVYLFASLGLHDLSLRYERRLWELFPEYRAAIDQGSPGEAHQSSARDGQNMPEVQALTFALMAMSRLYRGDFLDAGMADVAHPLRRAIEAADMSANIQKRWMSRNVSYIYCLFTGRISSFDAQLQACLDMFRRTHIVRRDSIFTAYRKAVLHEVAGRLAEAARDYQEAAKLALEYESFHEGLTLQGAAMFNLALADALPPQGLALQAVGKAAEWLDRRLMAFSALAPSCYLAAAAVTLARTGGREVPLSLARTMRRARQQALGQHQQRFIYRAAEGTLHWLQGRRSIALARFAEATTGAAAEGYLFQLLQVLRIVVAVVPALSDAHDYYRRWLSALEQSLNEQPTVKLQDVEAARFPPMPSTGQPAGPPPR